MSVSTIEGESFRGLEVETRKLTIPDWRFVDQPVCRPCQTETPASNAQPHNSEVLDVGTDLIALD